MTIFIRSIKAQCIHKIRNQRINDSIIVKTFKNPGRLGLVADDPYMWHFQLVNGYPYHCHFITRLLHAWGLELIKHVQYTLLLRSHWKMD